MDAGDVPALSQIEALIGALGGAAPVLFAYASISFVTDTDYDPDELIRQAYSVVAQPEKLFDLQVRLERAQARSGEAVAALDQHFDQIGALFDSIHHGPDADYSKLGVLPAAVGDGADEGEGTNAAPPTFAPDQVLRISSDWRVLKASADFAGLDVPAGPVPDWLFGYRSNLIARLRKAARGEAMSASESGPHYVRLYSHEDDERGFMAFAQAQGGTLSAEEGRDVSQPRELVFTRVSLGWDEAAGQRFAETMDLTGAEQELTRFIVEGRTITEFAQARGRSVGTARNQMKAILRKLGIGSQSELVSLYAGFAHSIALGQHAWARSEPAAFGSEVVLADGSSMRFERYGKAGGCPVLVLHGVIEGPFFTPNLAHRAQAAGIECFVPWMPFHEGRESSRKPLAMIELFASRLDQFCAALRIEHPAILACSLSCAYGLAALTRHPDRFRGLVMVGFVPALAQIEDDPRLNAVWRAPLAVARSAPGMIDMTVRALVRLAMRGEAYVYFDKLLKDSPLDRATLRQPDVRAVVRKAMANRPDKAGRALAHALLVQAQDWSEWLGPHEAPVRNVMGADETIYEPAAMQSFCEHFGIELVGPLPDTGSFSLFQQPQRIFAEVRSLFDD